MIYVIFLVVWIACGFIGASMARSQGRDPSLWFFMCVLTGVPGLVVLAVIGSEKRSASNNFHSQNINVHNQGRIQIDSQDPQAATVKVAAYNIAKWKALKEFDVDIQNAAATLSSFGQEAENRLAAAYLAVDDKGLLPAIVAKIAADEKIISEKREAERERTANELSEKDREVLEFRALRAQETISEIRESGMMLNGKKVVSAEIYDTDVRHEQGYAKVVFADGSIELRAGTSWRLLRPPVSDR